MPQVKTASFLQNIDYKDQKPSITVMLESETSKEIRIAFLENQVMQKHQAPYPIVVEVMFGEIAFGVEDTIYALKSGDIISLDANVPHDLLAKEKSLVRLSLSKFDTRNLNKIFG